MRRAERVSLFEREVLVRLSQAAIELLLASASVLSEGQTESGRYFGSTMLTIDLARVSPRLSESCDLATARAAESLLAADPRIADRARGVAIAEARRLAGRRLQAVSADARVRRADRHFHIDVDIEAELAGEPGHETSPAASQLARRRA